MNTKINRVASRRGLSVAALTSATALLGTMSGTTATAFADDKPIMKTNKLAQPANEVSAELRAGPVHVKFTQGELRYLYVGDHEIVRRIYFAVRNGKWETATPVFSKITFTPQKDSFTIDLEATCNTRGVDYHWTGHIDGSPDGTIVFHAKGESGAAFKSNRIGICVLYGTPAVTGKRYTTTTEPLVPGLEKEGKWPVFVSPELVEPKFNTLEYSPSRELKVSTKVTGTKFDMEDQRTYGDSSFKAYAPLAYTYPDIPANTAAEETVTVSLVKAPMPSEEKAPDVVMVRFGKLMEHARIPKITVATTPADTGNFGSVNEQKGKLGGRKELVWSFTPGTHLEDNDVYMENAHVLTDQVNSVHVFAPGARITLNPIVLNVHWDGDGSDPRGAGAVGSAWSMSFVKQMALAGVAEGVFATGPGLGAKTQEELAKYAGRRIYNLEVKDRPGPPRIDGFAIEEGGKPRIGYFINQSADEVKLKCVDLPGPGKHTVELDLPPYTGISLPLNP